MSLIAYYRDPEKKGLQRLQIGLLVLMAPFALYGGGRAFSQWRQFRQAENLLLRADLLTHEGQTEAAVADLEQCVALYPEFYAAWELLGVNHHMAQNHTKEVDAYRRAIKVLPLQGELYRDLATALHEMGDHQAELANLNRANELLPGEGFTQSLLKRAQREHDSPARPDAKPLVAPAL